MNPHVRPCCQVLALPSHTKPAVYRARSLTSVLTTVQYCQPVACQCGARLACDQHRYVHTSRRRCIIDQQTTVIAAVMWPHFPTPSLVKGKGRWRTRVRVRIMVAEGSAAGLTVLARLKICSCFWHFLVSVFLIWKRNSYFIHLLNVIFSSLALSPLG